MRTPASYFKSSERIFMANLVAGHPTLIELAYLHRQHQNMSSTIMKACIFTVTHILFICHISREEVGEMCFLLLSSISGCSLLFQKIPFQKIRSIE